MGERQVHRQMDRDDYIRAANIIQGRDGIWRSAGCGCRILRGYCEACPECVDQKIRMTGYSFVDRPHPVIGWTGMIRGIVPIEACGRKIEFGFLTREDFDEMSSALDRLLDRCFELKPRQEHFIVARWSLFGGRVEIADGNPRLLPFNNATAIARKLPRLSLTPQQVRLRLRRMHPKIEAVRDAMARGILLPDDKAARDKLELRLWERFIRARVMALSPGRKV